MISLGRPEKFMKPERRSMLPMAKIGIRAEMQMSM
jgi:hypothetical protein